MISTVIGALGVSGIGASVVQTSKIGASKAGVAGLLALPVCGFLQFLTHGSSSIAPTLAQKAELHVKASAGWQRIGRLTHAYRTQIRHMPPGSDADPILIPSLYRELVEACEEVSKITTVRSDTCDYFSKADNVYTVLNTRKSTMKRFEELEAGAVEPSATHQ
ncbi:hypothetical protein C0Q70_15643 [Pomacea canaliculata]|uniref:Uncharacterized protein n=2 Tax=Pomacea canaliculata TaxID=400727 RepID=A0A2T7NVF8_POMCA|nr:hypothetical protein C0Q70_15643 [Pomacea canaliculata]